MINKSWHSQQQPSSMEKKQQQQSWVVKFLSFREIKLLLDTHCNHSACNEPKAYNICQRTPQVGFPLLLYWRALMWIFRVNFISVCHYTSFPTLQTNTQYKTTIWLLPSNIPEEVVHNIAATEAKNKEFSLLLFLSQTLK